MTATLQASSPRPGAPPCAPWPRQGGFFGLNRAVTNTDSTSTCTDPDRSDRVKWMFEGHTVDSHYENYHAHNMVLGPSMIYYRTYIGPLAINRDDGSEAWYSWAVNPSISWAVETTFYVTDVILGSNNVLFVPAGHARSGLGSETVPVWGDGFCWKASLPPLARP